jgi:hypothetical protein
MIVVNKNEGPKVAYSVTGNIISFKDELMLNLSKYERDDANHIDICSDSFGCLVCGTAAGLRYVAEIDIPARTYVETPVENPEEGEPDTRLEPVPFDIDACTLTLWSLEV